MQVDSKPFPPPVINMVNAQLRAEYREVRQPAKGNEPLAEPEPVPCSRCKSEIGQLRLPENKRKAIEPSRSAMRKFGGQYDRRPARPSASKKSCFRPTRGTRPQYFGRPQRRSRS
ncbi:unnamed protein product [Prunus armeniaca]